MSEKEYKDKCESMFKKNTILINENEELKLQIESLAKINIKAQNIIEEQKSQIENMKCCGNCCEPCWNPPIVRKSECLNNNYSLWEMKQ